MEHEELMKRAQSVIDDAASLSSSGKRRKKEEEQAPEVWVPTLSSWLWTSL